MDLILFLPLLVFSVIIHEVAHGFVALSQGDDTALVSGRLTLNPVPHLDPLGSVIFPAICVLMKMPVFGWAKPVPVNPLRFNHYRSGTILVSLAGPLSNFLLSVMFVVMLYFSVTQFALMEKFSFLPKFLNQAIILNLVLAVFNLFPIPPLDGSRVVSVLLPSEIAMRYDALEPYGFFIVMGLISFGVFGKVLYPVVYFIYQLMLKSVGVF